MQHSQTARPEPEANETTMANMNHSSRRAVIDVGTNSVKLLVAEVAGREVRPLAEESRQTRLGRGFYHSHRLQPEPIAQTAAAVADFSAKAKAQGTERIRVIATSAARDAVNSGDLVAAIRAASGLEVEIISGAREADWAFQGVSTDATLGEGPLLLLELGGGSMQLILGESGRVEMAESFPLGTVRLLEKLAPGDPPSPAELAACREWVRRFFETEVRPTLSPLTPRAPRPELVGTGGTASILGCMEAGLDHFDRGRLEATRLGRERLRWHVERLWGLPLAQRKTIVGLPPNRADVILIGSVVYEAALEVLDCVELRISTRGLRFAALIE